MSFGGSVKLTGESEYRKALKDITSSLKLVSSELKLTNTEFTSGDKTLKQTKSSYENMSKTLEDQKKKVSSLREALAQAEKEYGSNNEKVKMFKTQLNNAENQLKEMEKATDKTTDELKDMKAGFEDASDGALKFGDVLKANVIGDFIVDGLKKVGSAIVDIGKQAISGFGEFEQLEGGIKKLFGDDMETVIRNSNNAYKTAGMDANTYLETVTSFSASLITSLKGNTEKATEYSDRAIRDMSDNANTFGTDIESLQNAYQGFAKSNFGMLDNLKLGYGGTKEEMKRLIKDASKMKDVQKELGVTVDSSSMSFANIVNAISVVQKKMQITGTTFNEASGTIEGSISSMKSAWTNWVSGLANEDADLSQLTTNLANSLTDVINNLKPVIKTVMESLGQVIVQVLEETLPEDTFNTLKNGFNWFVENKDLIIASILGIGSAFAVIKIGAFVTSIVNVVKAIKSASTIFTGLKLALTAIGGPITLIIAGVTALVAGFIYLWNNCEGFRNFWINLWENIKVAFTNAWNNITIFFTETIPNAWNNLVAFFQGIPEWFSNLWQSVLDTITAWGDNVKIFFTETIPKMWQSLVDWFNSLPEKIGYALGYAIGKIIQWGVDTWNYIVTNVPIWIENISKFFSELPEKIWTWLSNVIDKVKTWGSDMKQKAIETGTNFINNVISFFKELPEKVHTWLTNVIGKVSTWASDMATKAKEGATNTFNNIVNTISELPAKMSEMGKNIVEGLINGIENMASWVYDRISGFCSGVVDGVKSALGIHSPSKVFEKEVGKNMALGLGQGFTKSMGSITKDMQKAIPTEFDTKASINGISANGSSYSNSNFDNMVNAFKQALTQVKIEMNDREMGTFVTDTLERVVYN